jgi:ABC-type nickel/cobalt efflux system permease component RcnA
VLQRIVTGPGKPKQASIASLSDRELEVFHLIGVGHGTREIAEELGLSVKTVESYQAEDRLEGWGLGQLDLIFVENLGNLESPAGADVTSLLPVLALGFFLGMRHATDPDHVIAVSTIVSRYRSAHGAAAIGIVWGVGHSLTILLVGGGIVLFGWVIPSRLGLSIELAVGVMLVVLGLANLRDLFRLFRSREPAVVHSHAHQHGDYVHTHPHRHDPESHPHKPEQTPLAWLDRHFRGLRAYQLTRPLVVGIVHGLAGSAAVALLVLAAVSNPQWAVLYLLVFSVGTIVGMMLITLAIAVPFAIGRRQPRFAGRLRLAAGLISVGFGCFLIYQIGFAQGLFTALPH